MRVFKYTLKPIDPLFYAREGLAGAISPRHLHATAINCAVAYALNVNSEDQPYITSEANGGANIPRYENSKISDEFYFTPARPRGNISYLPEIAKGEADGFIRLGFGGIKLKGKSISRPEVLKAYQLFFIPPEVVFEGYFLEYKERLFPKIIRLGSFRGKVMLETDEVKVAEKVDRGMVSHPVDPLVSKVIRGMMINILPYPIVENALCENCVKIREEGLEKLVALPYEEVEFDSEALSKRIVEIEEGITAVRLKALTFQEKARLLLYMLRTAISMQLFLNRELSSKRLNSELKKLEYFDRIRAASKGKGDLPESIIRKTTEDITGVLKDVREKKEKEEGNKSACQRKTSRIAIF